MSEYVAFGDECSRMDPMSMVRAIDSSFCTTCGDNVTQPPLEECDDGAANSYEPNACRPDCTIPSCGGANSQFQTNACMLAAKHL